MTKRKPKKNKKKVVGAYGKFTVSIPLTGEMSKKRMKMTAGALQDHLRGGSWGATVTVKPVGWETP